MNRKIKIFTFLTILLVGVSLLYSCKDESEQLSAKVNKKTELAENEMKITCTTDTSNLSYSTVDFFKTISVKYSAKSIPNELSYDFVPEYKEVGDIHVLSIDDNIYSMECDGDEFTFKNFRTEDNKIVFDAVALNNAQMTFSIEKDDLTIESIIEYLTSDKILPNPFNQQNKVSNAKWVWVAAGVLIAAAAIIANEVGRRCTNIVTIEAENCRRKGGIPHAQPCSVWCEPQQHPL